MYGNLWYAVDLEKYKKNGCYRWSSCPIRPPTASARAVVIPNSFSYIYPSQNQTHPNSQYGRITLVLSVPQLAHNGKGIRRFGLALHL